MLTVDSDEITEIVRKGATCKTTKLYIIVHVIYMTVVKSEVIDR